MLIYLLLLYMCLYGLILGLKIQKNTTPLILTYTIPQQVLGFKKNILKKQN